MLSPMAVGTWTVGDVLRRWPRVAAVFVRHRMACVGCAMAPFETLAEAAAAYRLPVEAFTQEVADAIGPGAGDGPNEAGSGGHRPLPAETG